MGSPGEGHRERFGHHIEWDCGRGIPASRSFVAMRRELVCSKSEGRLVKVIGLLEVEFLRRITGISHAEIARLGCLPNTLI